MPQQELVKIVIGILERLGIPYMITGSVISSLQGEPRSTHDIDFVIVITADKIAAMTEAFPHPPYYISPEAVRDAVQQHGMFNLISSTDGLKVDFWILTDEPFDQSRFARRQPTRLGEYTVMASKAEDTILMKLRWAKMQGGSEKQMLDAIRVYEVQWNRLDHLYLDNWARRLDLFDDYEKLKRRAEQQHI